MFCLRFHGITIQDMLQYLTYISYRCLTKSENQQEGSQAPSTYVLYTRTQQDYPVRERTVTTPYTLVAKCGQIATTTVLSLEPELPSQAGSDPSSW